MGGCRCTYRNCSQKSDGKTHMFHYPVFDKVRCHQWIINAQRNEFLNLKVSQLKNRVICQHHFKDDNFMNYKKEKLTFEAVPTEDGPFCDPSKWKNDNKNNVQSFPLITEDIENEYLTYSEKKANYSIKYANFLTNCDLDFLNSTNSDPITLNNKNYKSTGTRRYSDKLIFQPHSNINVNNSPKAALAVVNPYEIYYPQSEEDIKLQEIIIENNAVTKEDNPLLHREYPIETVRSEINNTQNEEQMVSKVNEEYPIVQNIPSIETTLPPIKKEPKVRIISEKKIKQPISIPANLQSVSPSLVIKMPKKYESQQASYSLDLSTEKQHKPPAYSVDLQVDKVENPMYSVDFKEQTQENLPMYTVNLSGQQQENQPTYSIDLSGQKYENQYPMYSIDINGQREENQPSVHSIDLNEQKQNNEPSLYTIDINGHKQANHPPYSIDLNAESRDNQQPVYSIDLNVVKKENGPNYSLNLGKNQSEKNLSVIRVLKDKYMANIEYEPVPQEENNSTKLLRNTMLPQQLSPKELPSQSKEQSRLSVLKSKISPNRLAAIEEKRKFNKKLRDAIESCLTKSFEEKLEAKAKKSENVITNLKIDREKDGSEQISSYLSTEPHLPSIQEYTLKFLESRLERMENRLLNKIDQNSQKIQEIKNSFTQKPEKRTSSMQTGSTDGNVGSYKRYLYQEISQFLSADCNSVVYEELFINKYSLDKKNESVIEVKKKRRCR